MLQYRLFVEVNNQRRDVEKMALEQLHSWLRKKGYAADALESGTEVNLGNLAKGSLTVSERPDGSRSLRALINERKPEGQWTTQLTVDMPGNTKAKPWLWLDLNGPESINAKVPGLARQLLEVFDATSQGIWQGEARPVQTRDDVHALVEAVCDPGRRTLLFVAGSDPRLPFDKWLGHVRNLLRETVGLAGGYVLSPEATETFNNAIGPAHEVHPWTVRTFRPGVEPDDAEDARRHKVLGMDRIVNDSVRQLAPMLGRRAREVALQTPLPTAATKVERVLARIINANLLAKLDKSTRSPQGAEPTGSAPQPDHAMLSTSTQVLPDEVVHALELAVGGEITAERILELSELADQARSVQVGRGAIEARLDAYETEVADLRSELRELNKRLEDTQLDAAVAEEGQAKAVAEVRRLQKLLVVSDQASRVWTSGEGSEDRRPEAYEELADRLTEWSRVSFTGDLDKLLELDQYDAAGGWAGKVWDIIGALDDYARAVLDGTFDGGVHRYLTDTPTGYRTYSAARHAADESEDVNTNPQYRTLRVLPVPTAVSPQRSVFMGAHFKIAQYGVISPRLHYYNGVRTTGMIYIGYIGRHLRSSRTN